MKILPPLPMPERMTEEEFNNIPISLEAGWREMGDYVHKECYGPPFEKTMFLHPHTNSIIGCAKCGYRGPNVIDHIMENPHGGIMGERI